MATRNKGKKASRQQFNKNQIDIIKFFRDFKINILKHKVIHGIMVGPMDEKYESDDVKLIGFVSVPLEKISQDTVIKDKLSNKSYCIIGDSTCVVNGKFNLNKVESEYNIIDNCAILYWLQEAVDEGLCEFTSNFDILFLDGGMSDFEDLSNDMNERY